MRLNRNEQRTLLTLWCVFRSPLMTGGNLLQMDAWTKSLLTNPEVIAVDQSSIANRPVIATNDIIVWLARQPSGEDSYIAIFNISDMRQVIHYEWKDLGLAAHGYKLRDLWLRKDLGFAAAIDVTLKPHAS